MAIMTDPDFASFGEPDRSRPEGYRLTHPRNETAPRNESASGSFSALTGFDPGRGSLGTPEVTVAWTPGDIAPDWATGASPGAESPAGGPDRSLGRPDSLMSSPDSVAIGSEPGTPISDSVAIPRQSPSTGPESGRFGFAAPWSSEGGSEFSAFLSHNDAEPERPTPELTAPAPGTGISQTDFGSPQPTAPPQLPRRTPGLPQRTPDFMHTTAEQSLFGEPAAESTGSESGHRSNGSASAPGDSAPYVNGSAFTSATADRASLESTATNEYGSLERLAAEFPAGGTESVSRSDHAEPTAEPTQAKPPAGDSTFATTPQPIVPPLTPENSVRSGQLTGPPTREPASSALEPPARPAAEPAPPADEAPNPPWLQPGAGDRRTADSHRVAAESDRYTAESGHNIADSNHRTVESDRHTTDPGPHTTDPNHHAAHSDRPATDPARQALPRNGRSTESDRYATEFDRHAADSNPRATAPDHYTVGSDHLAADPNLRTTDTDRHALGPDQRTIESTRQANEANHPATAPDRHTTDSNHRTAGRDHYAPESDRRTTESDRYPAEPDHYAAGSNHLATESDARGTEFEGGLFGSSDVPTEPVSRTRDTRKFAGRTAHSAPGFTDPHRTARSARHADPAETPPTGGTPVSAPTPDSRPAGTSRVSRRSAHRRAAPEDTPSTVDVHLVMHLLLASHTLETVADKAEAGEASLEDFIRAARVTRTATVDLVSAWFGGTTQMRQFAEALLAASEAT